MSIKIEQVSFRYPKKKEDAIKGVSLEVGQGQIFGLLGPSGSGKSTLQKLLIKLLEGYRGTITIQGRNLKDYEPEEFYSQIGVCFELPNHYNKLTALENLLLFKSFYNQKTHDPKELFEIFNLKESMHKRVSTYSKGMKMRLNFMRSILHFPKVLFLDEPTSGLDPSNAQIIRQYILGLKRGGVTVFLTTHNMSDVEFLCDHVAFFVDGTIVLDGCPKKLMQTFGEKKVVCEFIEDQIKIEKTYDLNQLGSNQEFLDLLLKSKIEALHSQEANLNDVFIKSTGKKIHELEV